MARTQLLTPLVMHAIKYFDAAARHLNFTKAAEELHVTQGAVSQQIRGLEEQVGVPLFKRLPRGLLLTREGERLHKAVHRALRELEAELQAIQPEAATKSIFVRSSPSFSMMWLMPRLNSFSRLYPDIEIRLRGELFGISSARMNMESIDALILYGQETERPNGDVFPLMSEYVLPVATKEYLERHTPAVDASCFSSHTLLHDDAPWEGASSFAEWKEWVRKATLSNDDTVEKFGEHGHQYNLSQLAVNAALLGQGIAIARASLIMEELKSGQLVPAVPISVKSSASYCFVMNPSKRSSRSTKVFMDWISAECSAFAEERDRLLSAMSTLV
ncbi:MAG TPA: LysR family transcriptional regulator [Noviherbaspirillum sp.]|nr:LysR family transcriptional regulator [Noviherbaspirillum sp.]